MRIALFTLVAASAALGGCSSTPYFLHNNASGALDCPESQVEVERDPSRSSRNVGAYSASGCGRTVTYECPNIGTDCRASQ